MRYVLIYRSVATVALVYSPNLPLTAVFCYRSLSSLIVPFSSRCGFGSAKDYALCPLGAACLGSYCLSFEASPLPYPLLPDLCPSCFQVLPLELHIALEIYVVPFSNAKVVGSFRMARLNMFRRKVVA